MKVAIFWFIWSQTESLLGFLSSLRWTESKEEFEAALKTGGETESVALKTIRNLDLIALNTVLRIWLKTTEMSDPMGVKIYVGRGLDQKKGHLLAAR